MPSIGFGEILVILVLALLIFGPRRLPEMGRTIGRSLREFRRAASDLRSELEVQVDEDKHLPRRSTPATRRRQIEDLKAAATSGGAPTETKTDAAGELEEAVPEATQAVDPGETTTPRSAGSGSTGPPAPEGDEPPAD